MARPSAAKSESGKPFDVGVKSLIRTAPKEWLDFLGIAFGNAPVESLDTDSASVNLAADGVLKVGGESPFGVHIECESGNTGAQLPGRLLTYNVLAEHRTRLPFQSVAVLMTKNANSPRLSGTLTKTLLDGTEYLTFRYKVVRLYELPPDVFLSAGLSLVPLTLLGNVPDADMTRTVAKMRDRLRSEITDTERGRELLAATYLLTGARYKNDIADAILKGAMRNMFDLEDSSTYRHIRDTGYAEGRAVGQEIGLTQGKEIGELQTQRDNILRIGGKRFGTPSPEIVERVRGITDTKTLFTLLDRILETETWDDFWKP